MNGVVMLSVLTMARVSQGAFYLSTEESNWFNVSSLCKLGTPNIVRGLDGHYADVDGIDLQNNEKIWTGFYRTVKILEYVDCVHVDDILRMNARLLAVGNEGSLAKCISECGRSHLVGVTKSKCFCIDEKSFNGTSRSKETDCTNQCRYPQGVACGLESVNDTYLSVYKHNEKVSGSSFVEKGLQEEEKHCLALNMQTRKFYWEDCNKKYNIACSTGYWPIRINARSSWIEATNKCFSNKLVPTPSSNAKTVKNKKGIYVWTGTIRMNIIYKVDNYYSEEEQNEERTFGILTKMSSNDKYLLTFENGLEWRRSLCQGLSFANESPATRILIGICVMLGVLIVSVLLVYLYRRRKRHIAKIQANTLINTAASQGNNETVPNNNYEEINDANVACQQYYTTPGEILDQSDQVQESVNQNYQALQQVANRTSERYQSLDIEGREGETRENTTQTRTEAYESLQDRTIETHNYEVPTNE